MNAQHNPCKNFLFYLCALLLLCTTNLSQGNDNDLLVKAIQTLQERQNLISSVECSLAISGKTLPLFDNEKDAQAAAEMELEKLHQRKGDMEVYRKTDAYRKDLENNTRVFLQGYTSVTRTHRFRIFGVDNLVTYVPSDEGNELEQVLGRFSKFEADFQLLNAAMKLYPRTHHYRGSTPLFYHEIILDASPFLQMSIQEQANQIVISAVGEENSRFQNITYILYLTNNNFLPEKQIEFYVNPHQPDRDWKREIMYQNYKMDAIHYEYPTQIVETNWNVQPPYKEIKPWSLTSWQVTQVQFNQLTIQDLDFEIPKNTFIVNQFSKNQNNFSKTDKDITVFDLAKQFNIIPK